MASHSLETSLTNRLDSLQAMRSVAAILVVLFHLTSTYRNEYGAALWGGAFQHGEAGVDIFFVLSGFIIYYSEAGRAGRTRTQFFLARFIRIYPIYWLVLCGLVVIEWVGLSNDPERLDPWAVLGSALLLPGVDYVLVVAWTLSIEVIFYLLFGLTYFVGIGVYFTALAAWASISIAAIHLFDRGDLPAWIGGFLLYSGNAEFLFGGIVAHLYLRRITRFRNLSLLVGIVWFTSSLGGLGIGATLGMSREFDFGIPAALVIHGLVSADVRYPRFLVACGDSSYLLYLTHGGVLAVCSRIGWQLFGTAWMASSVTPAALALAAVLVAAAGYRTVEKPLLNALNARIRRSR